MSQKSTRSGPRVPFAFSAASLILAFATLPSAASAASTPVHTVSPSVQPPAAVGQIVEEEGVLLVQIEDYLDQPSRTRHFLKTASGLRHEIKFRPEHPLHLRSGTRLHIRGRLAGGVVTPDAGPGGVQEVAAAPAPVAGVQKTAVILVNFQDRATQPQTPSAVQNLIFGSVNNFYLESSFQTTSLSGNVFGWYTIPVASTSCDTGAIKTAARNAASAAGANLSGYSRFVYMFPNISACGWAGLGQIGGSPTDSWINGYFDRKIVAHELGHNLGLLHAHSMNCDSSPTSGTCRTYEYGDLEDTMGNGQGHFSAFQKEYLGWLGGSGMPPIAAVQSTGSYTLAPYAGSASGNKALKILKGTDSTGKQTWYYLEYRQPTGFDSSLSGQGNLVSGVTVRSADPSKGIFELDMTPKSTTTSDSGDTLDGALIVGKTYTDSTAGVSVTVTKADASGAALDVTVGGGQTTCKRAAPSILLSPSGQSATAGTTLAYTLAVTNNDTAACGSSTFNLARTLPSGWSGSTAVSSLGIAPGNVASTTLKVTSPSTAAAGSYSIGAKATSAASTLSGSGTATYTIGSGTTQPAASGTLKATIGIDRTYYWRGQTVNATATISADGKPAANTSVAFTLTAANGTTVSKAVTTGSTGLAVFSYPLSTTASTGTYRITAKVRNSTSSASAYVAFSVL